MSFSTPPATGSAAPTGHMSFGDHLLQAVGAVSPSIGGILGAAGVHPTAAQPTQPVEAVAPVDYSAVGQSNAKPQGGSVLSPFMSAFFA